MQIRFENFAVQCFADHPNHIFVNALIEMYSSYKGFQQKIELPFHGITKVGNDKHSFMYVVCN